MDRRPERHLLGSVGRLLSAGFVVATVAGCAGMTARERGTAIGAGAGAVGGAVLSGGSATGTAAGAVLGGVAGNQYERVKEKDRKD